MILENYLNRSKHDVEKMDAPSCRTERSGERHLITENYTIFKFFLSLNSKTFILKLFRYIVPIVFLLLCAIKTYSQPGSYTYLRIYLDKIEMYQVNVYMKSDNTVKLINSYLYDRSISYCDNLVNEKNVHIYEEPNKDSFFIDCNISKYCDISKNKVIKKQPKLIFEIIDVETSGKMYLYCFNFEEMRQHDPVVLCLDLRLTFVADRKYKIKYDDFVALSRKTPYKDAGTQELNLNKIIKNVN